MFYYTRSIDDGLPTQDCTKPLAEEFGDSFGYIGMGGILAGLMLFLTFLSSYCLWKKYDD